MARATLTAKLARYRIPRPRVRHQVFLERAEGGGERAVAERPKAHVDAKRLAFVGAFREERDERAAVVRRAIARLPPKLVQSLQLP